MRLLGVDVGGSTSRARLCLDAAVVAEAETTSASVVAAGAEAAGRALDELLARLPLGQPVDAAAAGVAGISAPGARELVERRLRAVCHGPVVVDDDAALVLPAAGWADGVGIVCGTGSVAHGRYGTSTARAGGWGYLLGDDGGGFWLARAAARTVLARLDAGTPAGALGADLAAALGVSSPAALLPALYADPRPRRVARLAPVVLAAADPAVDELLEEAADAVALLARRLRQRLGAELPVVLAGGLTASERYCAVVLGRLRSGSAAPAELLDGAPVLGAVRLAARALEAPGSASPGGSAGAPGPG